MEEQKNHWYSIWLKPKETIRDIVDTNPKQHMMLLAVLGGLSQSLASTSSLGFGKMIPVNEILMLSIFTGPLTGFFYVFAIGWFLHNILIRLGGTAEIIETRSVIAWSWVPIASTIPLWGVKYILFRDELFKIEKPFLESQPMLSSLSGLLQFVDIVLFIWTVIILIAGLSEVHKTPIGKTIGAFLILNLIMFIPSILLMSLCSPFNLL